MIPRDFIDTLLARVDIVDVIDRRVPLKKAGQNYQACCPFHSEKTPSFTVSPTKQFYHCFGCGAHGTALGFLMEYEHMGFPDAVAALAQDVGLPVPESGEPERPKPPPALWDALEQATQFFVDHAHMEPANAEREAYRAAFDPLYVVYTIGALQIRKLREDVRAKEGASFDLARFHERILSEGSLPVALLRRMLLNDEGPSL